LNYGREPNGLFAVSRSSYFLCLKATWITRGTCRHRKALRDLYVGLYVV